MKVTILIASFFLLALASQAQWSQQVLSSQKHYLYSTGEYVVGKEQAGKLGLNYTYKNKYTISVGYAATMKKTMAPTDEFLKSASNITPAYSTEPFENNENLHIMIGRIFTLDKQSGIRVVLQAGPGVSTYRSPEFRMLTSKDMYDYNIATKKKLSLVVNPKIEMPLVATLGCAIGPMLIVNNEQKYFGASVGIMYGIIKN